MVLLVLHHVHVIYQHKINTIKSLCPEENSYKRVPTILNLAHLWCPENVNKSNIKKRVSTKLGLVHLWHVWCPENVINPIFRREKLSLVDRAHGTSLYTACCKAHGWVGQVLGSGTHSSGQGSGTEMDYNA